MAKVYKNGPSKCQKHFRKGCDLNMIMRKHKFNLTGLLTSPAHAVRGIPQYRDFTSGNDYQALCNRVASFKSEFEKLPCDIRAYFKHNARNFVDFMYNISNSDPNLNTQAAAEELGLLEKGYKKEDIKARLINEGVSKLELDAQIQAEYEKKYPTPKE